MTEIPARLSVVTLGARDMGVLRSFYRALGWPELPSGDETWTGFLLGGVLLALLPLRPRPGFALLSAGAPSPVRLGRVIAAATAVDQQSFLLMRSCLIRAA